VPASSVLARFFRFLKLQTCDALSAPGDFLRRYEKPLHLVGGAAEEALKVLDRLSGAVEQTAEYLYQRGATVAVLGASRDEVLGLYRRAVEADPNHPGALFGLSWISA